MPRRALIIGIDGYANEAWRLDGAVRDALTFADWAIKVGGVAPGDLSLLLSPAPGAPPPGVPAGAPASLPATSQGIIDALAFLRRLKPEEGGDRVYVYFAGHGAALPQWNAEPVLIPADFSDPETHGHLLLGFSRIIPYLTPAPFLEQIFFLDACRDFGLPGYEPPLQSPVGPYRPVPGAVRQYVLYSVAPGQRAVQIGKGIWTAALLDGLHSPQAVSRRGMLYEVSLFHLAHWLRVEVSKRIQDAFLRDAAKFVQTPEYVPDPGGGDPVLATYTGETVPRVRIDVFIEPDRTHRTCRVSVKQYVDGLGKEIEVAAGPAPPILPPLQFDLRPADYSIQAQADDYTLASQPWTLDAEPVVELTLQAARAVRPVVAITPVALEDGGVREDRWDEKESLRGAFGRDEADDFVMGSLSRELSEAGRARKRKRSSRSPIRPSPAIKRPPRVDLPPFPGTLTVESPDPYVRVKLLDAKRTERERLEVGTTLTLPPGIYRLQAWIPGDRPAESTVEVRPGSPTRVQVSVPAPRLGDFQIQLLQGRGVGVGQVAGKVAYLHPSELLGPMAGVRFGSLLAYAAYAANWNGPHFNKLRSIGVPPFPDAGLACGVLVLLGVAGGRKPEEIDDFLRGCSVRLQQQDGGRLWADRFTALPKMPAAAASQTVLDRPGSLSAELRLQGFGPTSYALAALPGRITVLVAVLESDGSVDVQQLLLPLVHGAAPAWREFLADPQDDLAGPRNIRKVDLALRAFAAGEAQPLEYRDLQDLLAGDWVDPLLACVAGYSLVRAGQPERFLGQWPSKALHDLDPVAPTRSPPFKPSALANLLNLFPGLPDAWVLAGLCDPGSQAVWFEQAGRCGVPLFAEGLRALGQRGPAISAALAGLLPGSAWTAWTGPVRS